MRYRLKHTKMQEEPASTSTQPETKKGIMSSVPSSEYDRRKRHQDKWLAPQFRRKGNAAGWCQLGSMQQDGVNSAP